MRARPSSGFLGKWLERAGRWWVGAGAALLVNLALSVGCAAAAGGDRLVDIGGFRLHIHCTGSGGPTVILDAGAGDDWTTWSRVQPALSHMSRVCSYDRAGEGRSQPGPLPRTSSRMVDELRRLLQRAGINGPYVLVGHSLGATNMELYALTHPHEVAGLVLLDPATSVPPPPSGNTVIVGASGAGLSPAGVDEGASVATDLAQLRAARRSLGSLPLIVVTRAGGPASVAGKSSAGAADTRQQAAITRLSTNSEQVLAQHSGHVIQHDQPAVVIASVRQVLTAARHHGLLADRGKVVHAG
jgi:pimeloyl-ACP methyl ester carboxylesterase